MEFFKKTTSINFLGQRKLLWFISAMVVLVSLTSLAVRGLNFGIDFTGGLLVEMQYPQAVELEQVRDALTTGGFPEASVQYFGTARDVLVRLAPREGVSSATVSSEIMRALDHDGASLAQMKRVEYVGPQVGEELAQDGMLALLIALIGIALYVAMRFEYRLATGAIMATLHDVIATVGVFSLTGLEFNVTVLAGVLAIIGYSLNDTVVVYDRIRENFRLLRKGTPMEVANLSINQTLSRTIMTAGVTLLVVIAMLVWGGEMLFGFALALLVGIAVGTYSSIYVASATALAMGLQKEHLIPPKKEGAEIDDRP
ncbi:MAG: protein-export membrane protein SecF [Gammaproteobacteria bacterium RBG_16_57_12]|nr:MAG: protein-export membrane protein SecF [Gammaproteobacteria bacterium RBG_16_57_12]